MSSDEDYYDDDDYKEEEDDDDDDGPDSEDEEDYGFDYSAVYDEELTLRPRQVRFSVLSEADILQRQKEAIQDVASVLSIDLSDAATLLRHFKWSVSQVNDEWFQDEERVRKAVGLPSKATATPSAAPAARASESTAADRSGDAESTMTCGICFETHDSDLMKPALCNEHFFCDSCWKGYVASAIMDGPGCLNLRCPDPSCGAGVRESFVLDVAPDNLSIKYKRYLLRSYVDDNRNAKWCPAPGCEFAVEFFPDSSNYDITCRCGYHFCWSCLQEAHRPVDCDTVAKWILKNSAESENMNWILANSKACPKCRRPIEKNQGCMHMTCTPPCKYEFCWLCLGAWTEHGEKTGGFYACNRYESARHDGLYDDAERRRDMAKSSLEKYTHYYERWAANEQSRVKALESLALMQSTKIEVLSEKQSQPISQLKFVLDAWQQVVECRRVLKWTYAYGYYLPESDHAKRQFFEYLQGEADSALENLHKMAEKELSLYIDGCQEGEEAPRPFNDFRSRLAGLTSVTHTYFENLVRALENGLADVEQQEQKQQQQQQQQQQGAGSSSNTASAKGKKPEANSSSSAAQGVTTRSAAASTSRHGKGMPGFRGRGPFGGGSSSTSGGGNSNRGGGGSSAPAGGDEVTHWSCDHCTFANQRGARTCAMCNLPRGAAR